MNQRLIASSALASVLAMGLLSPAHADEKSKEKCFGIAKAGQNDCASAGNNECAGTAKVAMELRAWIYVPKGYCNRIQGGTTVPRL